MRAISPPVLRWSAGMGALGAGIGVLALLVGALLEPIQPVSDALSVAIALFVRSLLALLALAITLLLAHLAGYRIELTAPIISTAPSAGSANITTASGNASAAPAVPQSNTRMQAALAGIIILFVYWLGSTLYIALLGSRIGGVGAQSGSPLTFTISHVILGAVYVGLGAGFASLGGRAAAARRLMRNLTQIAAQAPSPHSTSTPASGSPADAPQDAQSPSEA